MVTVRWKIGKKPRGRWRTPFDFSIEINGDEYAKYRPKLEFSRSYELPGKVYMGYEDSVSKDGGNHCKNRDTLWVDIDEYIEGPYKIDRPFRNDNKDCRLCGRSHCRMYLECRKDPDYSDFEQVFYKIATDLQDAWDKAVEDALSYNEGEEKEEVITGKTTVAVFEKQKEGMLLRKIKVP